MGPDALGTAENKFGSTKYENGTWPLYRRKLIRRVKHKNGSGRPQYRRKRVRERIT
jgi:hypothetical protein